jgi:hypothetical protein
MTLLLRAFAAALVVSLTACNALNVLNSSTSAAERPQFTSAVPTPKPASPAKKPDPKPEPTRQALFEYIRAKLLAYSPNDGINDNLEVVFNPAFSTLSISQPSGRCDLSLDSVDINSLAWDVFDPSETYHPRPKILRLTLNSLSEKTARTCYDKQNQIDASIAGNRYRLLFSLPDAVDVPDFTDKMEKAVKKLVVLSGGTPQQNVL